ncbi:MAG: response regulator [Candidatus Zixiibacteriota bacterium]
MKKILFVDDSPEILSALERMLYKMKGQWEISFALSGSRALEILAEAPFDAIVSDMRMPEMNGAQLLQEVKRLYPGITRIILSGHSDYELIMQCVGCTHQYLAKPCEARVLVQTLENSFALRALVSDENLTRKIAGITSIPTLPRSYRQLVAELGREDCSIDTVAAIISADVGMTTKMLHLVNSSFFGLAQQVASPARAVSLLGLDTVRALVLAVGVFDQFKFSSSELNELERIYSHSMAVGALAQKYALELKLGKRAAGDALLAGILHDVGKPVMMLQYRDEMLAARELAANESITSFEAERRIFGVTHAEIGAYLISLWGESDSIADAVAFHHEPQNSLNKGISPLTAVYLADTMITNATSEVAIDSRDNVRDSKYLELVGISSEMLRNLEMSAVGIGKVAAGS